jgi:hypothetical protein
LLPVDTLKTILKERASGNRHWLDSLADIKNKPAQLRVRTRLFMANPLNVC